ncbi:MAG: ROK family protein [Limimaricola sp.]|uniref:ROK family transcriptional regulator n=1 Tax=Limimaricola sp. TaxID=2211665 RepID=UPI001D375F7F|nr:ROK family transcriptional regulator [Limimaricola sp.]MBI1416469.1 ROK family protein [Limimaricola sp.]
MERADVRKLRAGVNQRGVREHNERLILSMIQRNGAMPGSDLARITGLSPQTLSVILRGLETEGIIARGDPQRGRVGKPSVPMDLAPDGAFSVGLKIGRRSSDLVLTDLRGAVRMQLRTTYHYPMPDEVLSFLAAGLETFRAALPADKARRIAGIGLAKPNEIWSWHETIGAPASSLAAWREIDFEAEVARVTNLPVYLQNDATAACRAEHIYGRGREFSDYAYFFVGLFIGGGIVLNHAVFEGPSGNAGAFGPLPSGGGQGARRLIDDASLYLLEKQLEEAGMDPVQIWAEPLDWSGFPAILETWIDHVAWHLARAALTVCAVIDFEAVLIDGAFPLGVRERIVAGARAAMATMDTRGVIVPRIEEGRIGGNARALGAASAPIFAQYFLDTLGGSAPE